MRCGKTSLLFGIHHLVTETTRKQAYCKAIYFQHCVFSLFFTPYFSCVLISSICWFLIPHSSFLNLSILARDRWYVLFHNIVQCRVVCALHNGQNLSVLRNNGAQPFPFFCSKYFILSLISVLGALLSELELAPVDSFVPPMISSKVIRQLSEKVTSDENISANFGPSIDKHTNLSSAFSY